LLLAAACTAGLAACTGTSTSGGASTPAPPSPTAPAVSLAGTSWTLGSYRLPSAVSVPAVTSPGSLLELGAAGSMSGTTGCNRLAGRWSQDSASLTLVLGPVTQVACVSMRASQQERAVLDGLAGTRTFRTGGEELTLLDATGATLLVYRAVELALVGPTWHATAISNGAGGLETNAATSRVTAVFGGSGYVTGSTGCNSYGGRFTTTGADGLTIGTIGTTEVLCKDDKGSVESQYLAVLPNVRAYRVGADGLALLDAKGATLATFAVG
jgi:heat shock protein HslJ